VAFDRRPALIGVRSMGRRSVRSAFRATRHGGLAYITFLGGLSTDRWRFRGWMRW
jgi:hypothetical protein